MIGVFIFAVLFLIGDNFSNICVFKVASEGTFRNESQAVKFFWRFVRWSVCSSCQVEWNVHFLHLLFSFDTQIHNLKTCGTHDSPYSILTLCSSSAELFQEHICHSSVGESQGRRPSTGATASAKHHSNGKSTVLETFLFWMKQMVGIDTCRVFVQSLRKAVICVLYTF